MKTRVIDRPWIGDGYRYLVQARTLFTWRDVDSYQDLKRAVDRARHMAEPPVMWVTGDSTDLGSQRSGVK